jgi:hypothetical protein
MKKQMMTFTDPQHRRIKSKADKLGISFSELVRRELDRRIKRHRAMSLEHDGDKVLLGVNRSDSEQFEVEIPFRIWDEFEIEWLKGHDINLSFSPPDVSVWSEGQLFNKNGGRIREESLKDLVTEFCNLYSGEHRNNDESKEELSRAEALISDCLAITRSALKKIK